MKCTFPLAGLWLGICVLFQSSCASPPAGSGSVRRTESYISNGHRIKVETYLPNATGQFPAVLVLHGSSGTWVGKGPLVDLCKKLAAEDKVALLVHYFNRTDTIWSGDDAIHKHWPTWAATVRDAVDFASRHPNVRPDSIGTFGFSLGAYLAVSEAADDPRVKAVAELSGGLFDAQKPRLTRLPSLLVLHGQEDQIVPVKNAAELEQYARRFSTPLVKKIYPGEGHVFSTEAIADATHLTLKFFDERLVPKRPN